MATSPAMHQALREELLEAHEHPLSATAARRLAEPSPELWPSLARAAAARRDRRYGARLTFSPKVFLPLTNLCRNFCDYCSFRKSPGMAGAWTMTPSQVEAWLDRGRELGALEALLCLGDRPESVFPSYQAELQSFGHASTVDYLEWAAERALARGLLPHTNAGLLTPQELRRLKLLNPSMGLMLENVSERLCQKGMPHHRARDKQPALRLRMIEDAGRARIAFTSGVLIGIGETPLERVDSLLALRDLHRQHGHLQEVIVQNFRAAPAQVMVDAPEPTSLDVSHAVALARLILPDEVSVQAPPNLNPHDTARLIAAGINDFGGISPATPDYINPRHPWPLLARLGEICARQGFELTPRLTVYPRFARDPSFVVGGLSAAVERAQVRCAALAQGGFFSAPQGAETALSEGGAP